MTCTVTIDQTQVLYAVHEYLEKIGQSECLIALENNCEELASRVVPMQLSILRQLCMTGAWDEVIDCIHVFQGSERSKECLYEATRQWYLEKLTTTPQHNSQLDIADVATLKDLLAKLKELCPSQKDYSTLQSLAKLPSVNTNADYAKWSLSPARLIVFQRIASCISAELNIDANPHSNKTTDPLNTKLVQLIAKGLMYEKCEQICLSRCSDEKRPSDCEMLELSGWMTQQPDSAYQISPSCCRVTFLSSEPISEPTQPPQTTVPSRSKTRTVLKPKPETMISPIFIERKEISQQPIVQLPTAAEVSNPIIAIAGKIEQNYQQSSDEAQTESAISTIDGEEENRSPDEATRHRSEEVQPVEDTRTKKLSSVQICDKTQVLHEFEDHFVKYSPPSQFQSPIKTGRDSSTPKPSSSVLPPSPPTSPVTHTPHPPTSPVTHTSHPPTSPVTHTPHPLTSPVTHTPQRLAAESRGRTLTLPRRFDFNQDESGCEEEMSIEWPTATLLSQVTDTQAIRAVSFSQTGDVVAVGANSRTLRLCSTKPLLEGKISSDLPVFYHHSSYHKGSIYCLAWRGDTLLASGSNDHHIRLLSYDPTRSDTPCRTLGSLNVHSGTIRDLVFTPSGLLVSGGAVDFDVKLCDPVTKQIACSLTGHSEQVLALDVMDDNLIASGSQDKTIRLWDIRQEEPIWTITSGYSVNSLSICSPRDELVSSHEDGSCSIHSLRGGKTRVSLHPHTDDCRSVKWSPRDGQWILSGSYDGTVCLTHPGSAEWTQMCEYEDKVIQVKWHCGGQLFATTSADKRARFWTIK